MAFIQWSDNLSVGNIQMDNQHKKLVAMINDLHDAMSHGKGTEVIGKIINDLTNYTVVHFQDEERLMATAGFPDLDAHTIIHEQFVKKVAQVKKDFQSGRTAISVEIITFLKNWLTDHIQKIDKEYSSTLV